MELPRLEQLWQKYQDEGLQIVAVEGYRDREGALAFIEENNLTYHMLEDLEDDEQSAVSRLGVGGYPTSYLVDRSGKIIFAHYGFRDGDEVKIEKEIQKLLS